MANLPSAIPVSTLPTEDQEVIDSIKNLPDGAVPKVENGKFVKSGQNVDPTSEEHTFDKSTNFPQASVKIGVLPVEISEGGGFALISNPLSTAVNFAIVDTRFDDTGSFPPRYFDLIGKETLNIQETDTTVIITNPLSFSLTTAFNAQTNKLIFKANGPMTNVSMKITDNITGTIIKHVPSRAAFDNGVGGVNLITGINTIDFVSKAADTPGITNIGLSPFRLDPGVQLDIVIKGDTVDLLGDATEFPFLDVVIQKAVFRDLAKNDDVIKAQNTADLSGSPLTAIDDQIFPTNLADVVSDGTFCVRNTPADVAAFGLGDHVDGDVLKKVGTNWKRLLRPVAGTTVIWLTAFGKPAVFVDEPVAGNLPVFTNTLDTGEAFSVAYIGTNLPGQVSFDGTLLIGNTSGGLTTVDFGNAAILLVIGTLAVWIRDTVNPERSGMYNLIVNNAGTGDYTLRRDYNFRDNSSFTDGQTFFVGAGSGGDEANKNYIISLTQQFIINTSSLAIVEKSLSKLATQAAALTQDSLLFANANGDISQDNINLTWKDATKTLTVGNIGINVNTISPTDLDGDLILNAAIAGDGVVKAIDQLEIEGSTSQLLLTDSDTGKTYIVKNNLSDFSIVEVGGNNSFRINSGAASNSLAINPTDVTIGNKLIAGNLTTTNIVIHEGTYHEIDADSLIINKSNILFNAGFNDSIARTANRVDVFQGTGITSSITNQLFVAGVAGVSNPTLVVDSGVFAVGDLVLITDTPSNNGLFEMGGFSGTEATLRGIGTIPTVEEFTSDQLISGTFSGNIRLVNVSVRRTSLTGTFEHGQGNLTPITFFELAHTVDVPIIAIEEFASKITRFFGGFGLPNSNPNGVWTLINPTEITLVQDTVFEETNKQVINVKDTTGAIQTSIENSLSFLDWSNAFNFGAEFGGVTKAITPSQSDNYFAIAAGVSGNGNPTASVADQRFAAFLMKDPSTNFIVLDDLQGATNVILNGLGGIPLVEAGDYFKAFVRVDIGFIDPRWIVNGVDVGAATFGNSSNTLNKVTIGSGSSGGVGNDFNVANFGITILEESTTKTFSATSMSANDIQAITPVIERDFEVIVPDGFPRPVGSKITVLLNNVGGKFKIRTQNLLVPQSLFNGRRELEKTVNSVKEICFSNTIDNNNVYVGEFENVIIPIVTAFVSTEDITIANTVVETTLLGKGNGTLIIPANSTDIGDRFAFIVQGIMSSTANPTLRLQLKSGGVLLADTGATSIGNLANGHWIITGDVVTRTIGGVGTVTTSGSFTTSSGDHFEFVNIVPVVLDTTIDRLVDVTAIWGTAATGNTITQQIAHLTKFVSP